MVLFGVFVYVCLCVCVCVCVLCVCVCVCVVSRNKRSPYFLQLAVSILLPEDGPRDDRASAYTDKQPRFDFAAQYEADEEVEIADDDNMARAMALSLAVAAPRPVAAAVAPTQCNIPQTQPLHISNQVQGALDLRTRRLETQVL
jgi:hypothetical protein